jgi:transposase
MNAQRYRNEILDPVAMPIVQNIGAGRIRQDDNARPHTARIVQEHLQHRGIQRMQWPSCSSDLNPIKHLWDLLGRAVRNRVNNATTVQDLRQIVVDEWDAIPQQRVQRLISSMRRRCQAVTAVFGGSSHY